MSATTGTKARQTEAKTEEPARGLRAQLLKRGRHQQARVRVGPDVTAATLDRSIHLWDAADVDG
jgi:hypothetical protein